MACVYSPRAWTGLGDSVPHMADGRADGRWASPLPLPLLLLLPARSLTVETEPGACSVGRRSPVAGRSLALRLPGPFPTANRRAAQRTGEQAGAAARGRRGDATRGRGDGGRAEHSSRLDGRDTTRVGRARACRDREGEDTEVRVYLAGCGLAERRAATTTIGGGSCLSTHGGRPVSACQLVAPSHNGRN